MIKSNLLKMLFPEFSDKMYNQYNKTPQKLGQVK